MSDRSASFGFGEKYDFTKNMPYSPPSNTYLLKDEFQSNGKKGFGFGEGREDMLSTGPFVDILHNKNPGPGTYEIPSAKSKLSFTLSQKIVNENKEKLKIPGPGQYPVVFTLNPQGKYFLTKYKTSCVRDFSKISGRCKTSDKKVPGPGAYDLTPQFLSSNGRYSLSNLRNCLTRKFGTSKRRELAFNKSTPGPGNYRLPSEFGHYVAKNSVGTADQSKIGVSGKQNVRNA